MVCSKIALVFVGGFTNSNRIHFFPQYTVIYGANVRLFLILIMKNDIIIVIFEVPFSVAYHINALFTAP